MMIDECGSSSLSYVLMSSYIIILSTARLEGPWVSPEQSYTVQQDEQI